MNESTAYSSIYTCTVEFQFDQPKLFVSLTVCIVLY